MTRIPFLGIVALAVACSSTPQGAPARTPSSVPVATASASVDSMALRRRETVQQLVRELAGKENQPAAQVFANVQLEMLKNFPAARVLAVMDQGYGRSLGVSCEYCHVAGRWDSDSLPTKRIARQMQAMVLLINGDLLAKTGVRQGAVVNCTTCHRGASRPITNLDQRAR